MKLDLQKLRDSVGGLYMGTNCLHDEISHAYENDDEGGFQENSEYILRLISQIENNLNHIKEELGLTKEELK